MADLSKMILPNGDEYNLRDSGIVYCTCDDAAGTVDKVVDVAGDVPFTLRVGSVIGIKFSKSNSASNVTFNVGGTGAKHIWYNNALYTGNSNTVLGYANQVFYYMYDGEHWVLLSNGIVNADTYNRTYLNCNVVKAGDTAIVAGNIIVAESNGDYKHLKEGTPFDLRYPILYANAAINKNVVNATTYLNIAITITTTQAITLDPQQPVYIKGQLSGTTFTPVSTAPLTQIVPTTADGFEYIFLGLAYSDVGMYLWPSHPIFAFRGGRFVEIIDDADTVNGHTVNADVPSDLNTKLSNAYIRGNVLRSRHASTDIAPLYVEAFENKGYSDYFKSIKAFAGEYDWFYCADKNSHYTITSSKTLGTGYDDWKRVFNHYMSNTLLVRTTDLPFTLEIMKDSNIDTTDVLYLMFCQRNLQPNQGKLTDYKIEVFVTSATSASTLVANSWNTVVERSGVSDEVQGMIHSLNLTGGYAYIKGVRITITGITPGSINSGAWNYNACPISSIQLIEKRPAHTAAAALGALDIIGGTVYGPVNFESSVTADNFSGKINNHTVSADVPSDLATQLSNRYTKSEVDALVSSVFHYKGTKATYAEVQALTGMKTGDVWQVTADNSEYVYNGSAWEKLGPTIDLSGYLTSVSVAGQTLTPTANTITVAQLKTALGLKALAYKDSASTSYTPGGSVGTPTITVTPNTATVNSITAVGDLPELGLTVTGEKLKISWDAGALPTKGSNQTVVTGIKSATSSQPSWTGTSSTITVS